MAEETEGAVLQEAYTHLPTEHRATMVRNAVAFLQEQRFEAELNAAMSDDGLELLLPGPQGHPPEMVSQRIARIDRQIDRLREAYGELLTTPTQ